MVKLKQRVWQWRAIIITAPSVAILMIALNLLGLFQFIEWSILDQFFQLRPREKTDDKIVVVTIDDEDLGKIGKWPLSDEVLAKLITKINAQKPRAIGVDIYRNLPVLPGDHELKKVLNSTPNLIGVEKVVGKQVGASPTLAKLKQVGMADLVLDGDGKIRRGLLSVKTETGETKLGLATRVSLLYLEKEGIKPGQNKEKQLTLGHAVFVPFTGNDGSYVNTNSGGFQILLNYRGTLENFKTISIIDVLEDRIPPGLMSDRIVLVGATGQSLNDLFLTPYSNRLFGSPKRIPGVIIHANIASQILNGAMNKRPFINVWNEQVEWCWILICSLIGAGGSWKLFNAKIFKKILKKRNFLTGVIQLIAILFTGGGLLIGSYVIFLIGWWIPVVSPLLAFNISAIAIAIYQGRESQRLTEKKLAQFLEAVPVAIVVLDAKGKPYYSNHKAMELLGKNINPDNRNTIFTEAQQFYLAGTNELYPPENLPIINALKGENTIKDDIEIHQEDKIIPLESMATPVYDEVGKIAYAIASFNDISERRKSEAEKAAFIQELSEVNQELQQSLAYQSELTNAYGRFVPREFLDFLGYDSIVNVKLGDNIQLEMSILFTDIRDFTTLSENMTPEDNFKFINAFLSRMEPAIKQNNGFIDKYIGDAIMALFSGEADNAVRAAISMLKLLSEYNTTRGRPGREKIKIGIGINTGLMMLGTVGGEGRMESTVISDAVNLASRLEALTKNYGVSLLISDHTFSRLEDITLYNIRLLDQVKVKGKSELVSVFEVFDADPSPLREGKIATKTIFEQGLLFYNFKDMNKAAKLFETCIEINPLDKVPRIYLQRCQGS